MRRRTFFKVQDIETKKPTDFPPHSLIFAEYRGDACCASIWSNNAPCGCPSVVTSNSGFHLYFGFQGYPCRTIVNLPPIISMVCPPPPPTGVNSVTFAVNVFEPENEPVTITWDFGDNTMGSGAIITHLYPQAPTTTYIATVTVTDGTHSVVDTCTVEIINLPPTISITCPATLPVFTNGTFTAVVNDPDGDATTVTWDFGDGSPAETGLTVTHAYDEMISYTVTASVSDGIYPPVEDTCLVDITCPVLSPVINCNSPIFEVIA